MIWHQTKISFESNQSENGNYNPHLVWFNNIRRLFFCVYKTLNLSSKKKNGKSCKYIFCVAKWIEISRRFHLKLYRFFYYIYESIIEAFFMIYIRIYCWVEQLYSIPLYKQLILKTLRFWHGSSVESGGYAIICRLWCILSKDGRIRKMNAILWLYPTFSSENN